MQYSELFNFAVNNGMKLNRAKFTNEHGEDYVVIALPYTVMIAGHETDWDVLNLFNDKFNIWSKEELLKLANAIKELYDEPGNN